MHLPLSKWYTDVKLWEAYWKQIYSLSMYTQHLIQASQLSEQISLAFKIKIFTVKFWTGKCNV